MVMLNSLDNIWIQPNISCICAMIFSELKAHLDCVDMIWQRFQIKFYCHFDGTTCRCKIRTKHARMFVLEGEWIWNTLIEGKKRMHSFHFICGKLEWWWKGAHYGGTVSGETKEYYIGACSITNVWGQWSFEMNDCMFISSPHITDGRYQAGWGVQFVEGRHAAVFCEFPFGKYETYRFFLWQ